MWPGAVLCFRGVDIENLSIIETSADAFVASPSASTVAVTKPVAKRAGRSVSESLATIKGSQLRDSPRKPVEDCSIRIPSGLYHCNGNTWMYLETCVHSVIHPYWWTAEYIFLHCYHSNKSFFHLFIFFVILTLSTNYFVNKSLVLEWTVQQYLNLFKYKSMTFLYICYNWKGFVYIKLDMTHCFSQ